MTGDAEKVSEHLWPHPTVAERFEELLGHSEKVHKRLVQLARDIDALKGEWSRFESECASTVRLSIMQRDNAEAAPSADERQRAMERDAARYKWLRDRADHVQRRTILNDQSSGIDAAIDRALSSAPKGG